LPFWQPEYAATLQSIHARDLWSWKSHQFEFVSEMATAMMGLRDRYAGDVDLAANLDADQKRFRIAELEQRIAEAGEPPRPELARHVGTWLLELGFLHYSLGEVRKAIEYHEEGLAIAHEIGYRRGEGTANWNMALALDEFGRRQEAIAHAEAALRIMREIEHPDSAKVERQLAAWRAAK
jgi:tetratricopeptide (TPR) repeat protein